MDRLDIGAEVACSLNDAEFKERRALARRTLIENVTGARRTRNGLVLTFENSGALRRDLEHFISLERRCCGFLDFSITDVRSVELTISGPSEAAATIDIFAAAVEGAA